MSKEEILIKIKQRKNFLESLLLLEDKSGINIDLAVGVRLDEINAIIELFGNEVANENTKND